MQDHTEIQTDQQQEVGRNQQPSLCEYSGQNVQTQKSMIRQFLILIGGIVLVLVTIGTGVYYKQMVDRRVEGKLEKLLGNGSETNRSIADNIRELAEPSPHEKNRVITLQDLKTRYPDAIIKQNNIENTGKELGQLFTVPLQSITPNNNGRPDRGENIYGIDDTIQVASQLDPVNMMSLVDFRKLEKEMGDFIAHELLSFGGGWNQGSEARPPKIDLTINSNLLRDITKLASKYSKMDFGIWLTKNIDNPDLRLLEYLIYDKHYNIGNNSNETPICIYSASYNIYSKNRYQLFFQSIGRQNYSNYHILYIDDNSPDSSAYHIFEYLNSTQNPHLTSRVTIVHNLQRMGALANMFFWTKRYCAPDSVVIIVDGDDSLLGTQTLQVINAVYRDPQVWYMYSGYLNYYVASGGFEHGYLSDYLRVGTGKYRLVEDYWVTSHLRTFRQKLMKAVPIYHFIEYHYNRTSKLATPRFYGSAADRYQAYSQIELAGSDRVLHIQDPLYLYDPTLGNIMRKCYREHQFHEQYKSRIKTPLKRLKSLNDQAELEQNYQIPKQILKNLTKVYKIRKQCNQRSIK